jgi:hypothetical protein
MISQHIYRCVQWIYTIARSIFIHLTLLLHMEAEVKQQFEQES